MNQSKEENLKIEINKLNDILRNLSIKAKRNLKILLSIFIIGVIIILLLMNNINKLNLLNHDEKITFPKTGEEMRRFVNVIQKYSEFHYYEVLILFIIIYIFLQSFAIPGPVILSILSGALYGKIKGLILVTICATLGATGCFLLSNNLAKYWIFKYFPNKIMSFKNSIENNKDNLFYYFLFLRITPLFPNWLLNLSSPIVGIPIIYFIIGTFIGLIPANIIHVSMGSEISKIEKIGFDLKFFLIMLLIGLLSLFPILIKRIFQKKFKMV